MAHTFQLNGLTLHSGDLICTRDGNRRGLRGYLWRFLGRLIPGEVDHIVIYVGPGGRCVEAGARGYVISFEIPGAKWDSESMYEDRRIHDCLVGVAYPLAGRGFSEEETTAIRKRVAAYCLTQAAERKPYNIIFPNCDTEHAFYCSQLAYKAYADYGINLNTGERIANVPLLKDIVLPQEIWKGCRRQRPSYH
ncbi:hypothetical protein JW905_00700 [bacterium]|nr:hypothetical protein [candidate division CSSED10-310 bacterium]